MAQKVMAMVKLQLPAGVATPGQPVGPALGQHGVNIMQFVKEYNARTAANQGEIIPVVITIYTDRSFSFATKTPPTSRMLLKAAGAPRGAKNPLTERAGAVTKAQIKEIAEKKMVDLNAFDLDAAMLMIEGTARSMGIKVED
ncbi:MAG: 50S ribosomal protein L11 [Anaerolineae bacterium]|jgi:large subunit ribosomal protein L11|nr:50S ribosomal protein L11 [Ardenticatenia bacterium]MBK8540682.1 50S ribosomal protein L11 [Ardenticatenia bacterium]HQZ70683.1 50S ribosomal protein L11 [Anaerolineae bacterium]HRA21019.1 50S ribosomal protein L11 [Anaerolineae bacterium]